MSDNKFEWARNANFHRLTEKPTKNFDCGNNNLNDVLKEKALKYSNYLGIVTYILENEEDVIAFYSLSNDSLVVGRVDDFWETTSSDFRNLFEDYNSFPAIKIVHLAINKKYKRLGIARHLLNHLVKSLTNKTNKTGCQFILVDALQTNESRFFYENNCFEYATAFDMNKDARLMYRCLI